MDFVNIKSCVSQPDACRCCLSASGSLDITASHITKTGEEEVYFEMLEECYNISLTCLSQWDGSHLICNICVGRLREASIFRKQVLLAERCFIQYCKDREGEKNNTPLNSKAAQKRLYQNLEIDFPLGVRKEQKLFLERDRLSTDDHNSDSDTPLSQLSRIDNFLGLNDKVQDSVESEDTTTKESNSFADSKKIVKKGKQCQGISYIKQVSDRKRVMLTCDVVLRDTTACPFRHHKSWFQCFFCPQDFMELNLLRQHTLQTHPNVTDELKKIKRYPRSIQIDISKLECRRCNLNLTDVQSMRNHFGEVHKKIIYSECIADYKVDSSPYSCHLCERQFHVFRTLTTHLNEHYANCICDVCGKSFMNSKRLKVHKRTHESGQYPCAKCGKVLKTKTSKANHMSSAHSERVMKCQICFKPMKHYNERIKHMSEVHNITHKFKCPICGREYNIKHYLATHIRQSHGHKNKKCMECGMSFITNDSLKKHMFKHSGAKPFTCSVCCKSYTRSYSLKEHMRGHANNKISAPE